MPRKKGISAMPVNTTISPAQNAMARQLAKVARIEMMIASIALTSRSRIIGIDTTEMAKAALASMKPKPVPMIRKGRSWLDRSIALGSDSIGGETPRPKNTATTVESPIRAFAIATMFWGYQFFIVAAAVGYVFGVTQGKEYAEPEGYVDVWLTVVWLHYLVAFGGTILRRHEPHIYVAN